MEKLWARPPERSWVLCISIHHAVSRPTGHPPARPPRPRPTTSRGVQNDHQGLDPDPPLGENAYRSKKKLYDGNLQRIEAELGQAKQRERLLHERVRRQADENEELRYGEDVFCDFLIEFMEKNRSKPFFAFYPMVLVHEPHEPTPESAGTLEKGRGKSKDHFPDMVAYMDRTVGRLIEALERLGLRERTLVIFTGDNGTARGITSRLGPREVRGGKGTMTHRGTHVPLIASWPGVIPPGRVSKDLIDFSDILPTLCEMTGARPPEGLKLDGRSFAPQLRGERGAPREWVFSQLGEARFARDRRFLLHGDGRLFDLENDPFEEKDLGDAGGPEAASARKKLKEALDKLR